MDLGLSILRLANRVLPAPKLPGDRDPLAYAEWEYATSDAAVRLWSRCSGPVERALDVGCGLGGKTLRLVEATASEVAWNALDIEFEHLRGAAAFHAHKGHGGVRWVQADAARLPYPDASFDRIVSADALEHFPEPRRTLAEFRRCLRPQGRLILLFNPWLSPRGSHLGDLLHLPWCQAFFDRDTLVAATREEAQRQAEHASDPARREAHLAQGESLVSHFVDHVHPTRIADLRRWLVEDATFVIESEMRVGPGPLARLGLEPPALIEEWWSATYGAVMRPLAA